MPPALDRLIAATVAKDSAARPQRIREVADELRAILRTGSSGSGRHDTPKAMPSVAVMPFRDLSPAHDQEYFCEGIADDIITALSGLGGIQVASRSSAVRCQEKGLDLAEIGQRLNVQHMVEGSVRKAGNRVRITAQLTSVTDGYQLWAERYDRDLDDVFAVQDDIARTIVERLRVKLAASEDIPLVRKGTDNPEAYTLCLKGRYHWARRNRWHLRAALECLREGGRARSGLCALAQRHCRLLQRDGDLRHTAWKRGRSLRRAGRRTCPGAGFDAGRGAPLPWSHRPMAPL